MHRVGGVVGEHRDLGGAGLGVDTDDALEEALGGRHVDVARAGDEVHRLADELAGGVPRAVGEHRHGLRAADGVDLVDAEQGARGEDRRVGQPLEARRVLALHRAGDGDRADAGLLRGDDVHDDAARVHREPAGHVQADPADRHPALHDAAARDHPRDVAGGHLLAVHQPGAADRTPRGPRGRRRRGPPAPGPGVSAGTRMPAGRTPSKRSVRSSSASTPRSRTPRTAAAPARRRARRRGRRGGRPRAGRALAGSGHAGRVGGSPGRV